jgi:hypothetical protein
MQIDLREAARFPSVEEGTVQRRVRRGGLRARRAEVDGRVDLADLLDLAAAPNDPAVRAAVDARAGEPAFTEALARVEDALARRRGEAQGRRP